MSDLAIIDYGMGNLRSVQKALQHVAPDCQILVTSDPAEVRAARHVVFPGQGAMPDCMRELDARGLRQAVLDAAASKPFLGICIGLQMLFEVSHEGNVPGLGLFRGEVVRFPHPVADQERLKVPHMGWNEVNPTQPHPLWVGISAGERFYFVHSYYPVPLEPGIVAARTRYPEPFVCAVARDNVFAVQFHPEKSQAAGLRLLANFLAWDGLLQPSRPGT